MKCKDCPNFTNGICCHFNITPQAIAAHISANMSEYQSQWRDHLAKLGEHHAIKRTYRQSA